MASGSAFGKTRPTAGATPRDREAMNSIQLFKALVSEGITVGTGRTAGPLTLFPLSHGLPAGDHLLYQDAHSRGLITIEETSEAGTVGELKVTNRGTQAVLLLEGEVLLGMKQTRVLNASILVPGLAVLVVPVSCVEVGRWRRTSPTAMGKDSLNLSPRVRGAKTASVMRSARATGRYLSDQAAVWDGVAVVLAEQNVSAPTGSYADIARDRGADILGRIGDLRPDDGQSGVLAYVDGRATCLDLFDGPATLGAVWEALIGSYAADADFGAGDRGSSKAKAPTRTAARQWLHGLSAGDLASAPSIGIGDSVTCMSPAIEATALVHEGRLLHLAAFPADGKRTRTSFVSPARRR